MKAAPEETHEGSLESVDGCCEAAMAWPALGVWTRPPGCSPSARFVGRVVYRQGTKIRTPNGVIVLENVPEDAVVEIDGEQITVTPTVGKLVKIVVQARKHGVFVRRALDPLLVESVTVESGKETKLTVRLESPAAREAGKKSPPAEGTPRESGTKS